MSEDLHTMASERPLGAPPGRYALAAAATTLLSPLEVDPTLLEPPLDWRALFRNGLPVEVELGCGKGMFLREAARLNPRVNYFGVERAGKYYRKAVDRLSRAGLTNIRLMCADALDVMHRWIPPGSIRTLHIYFPDPWPKKRHHKRRIFRPELMALAGRALAPGGELRTATDHAGCGAVIRQILASHTELFIQLPWPEDSADRLPTNYAIKWEREGRSMWWARFRLKGSDPGVMGIGPMSSLA